jgi:Multi-copper polyphenol oxidoreductase laccase
MAGIAIPLYTLCCLVQHWRSRLDVVFAALHQGASRIAGTVVLLPGLSFAKSKIQMSDKIVRERLIVFTRYPEAGKTKTRLIPVLGAEGAAKLQCQMTEHTLAQLQAQGSQLENLRVAMGPAISGSIYQVSAEVGATLLDTVADGEELFAILKQLPDSPVVEDGEPGKVRLDIRRAIVLQLERLGIAGEQVAIAPQCTYRDTDNFFSYRQTNQKNGQWSGIVSR